MHMYVQNMLIHMHTYIQNMHTHVRKKHACTIVYECTHVCMKHACTRHTCTLHVCKMLNNIMCTCNIQKQASGYNMYTHVHKEHVCTVVYINATCMHEPYMYMTYMHTTCVHNVDYRAYVKQASGYSPHTHGHDNRTHVKHMKLAKPQTG